VSASSFVATTVPDIVKMNLVSTSTQQPLFTGTKTNMVAVDNVLKLEADTLIDSITDLMDDWERLDALGNLDTTGSYEFDTYIDLGSIYTSRVTADLGFTAFNSGDFIDSRTGLVDDWLLFDDAPAGVTVNLLIAGTNDDPSGSPVWNAWSKFTVADYRARALKFKVDVTTQDPDHQINITTLTATVDMPDRVQGDNAIQSGVGTKSITYADAFYAIPSVGITGCDMDQNDRIVLSNETATGFDVSFYQGNGSGNPQDIKFNWQSRGF
jgi:hypothetical protein